MQLFLLKIRLLYGDFVKKILIVEDSPNYLEEIFNNVSDKIIENVQVVQICTDGKRAMEYLSNNQVDIVLLDLNLPSVNGIQILEYVRDNEIKTSVIVMSGENELVIELLRKGLAYDDILIKPFNVNKLIYIINRLISEVGMEEKTKVVLDILSEFNFNRATKGYLHIIECLNVCITSNEKNIINIEKLYQKVSKINNKCSSISISWNISKTIQSMNKLTDESIMKKYFPYNLSPSPKIFLNEILGRYYSSIQ